MVRVEKLAGIGRLAAGVAHEIRNPLGALGTCSEVFRRRGSDPAVVGEMHTAIGRTDRIVHGLLDYAR
jgi:signal transduction histidine kinase